MKYGKIYSLKDKDSRKLIDRYVVASDSIERLERTPEMCYFGKLKSTRNVFKIESDESTYEENKKETLLFYYIREII